MKFSETETSIRNQQLSHINQRWGQLYELEKESGEKILKYLLLINSGGAIATLSFLGALKFTASILGVKIALLFFVVGILFVGVSGAKQYHHMSKLFQSWKHDVRLYLNDELNFNTLTKNDEKIAVQDFWDLTPYHTYQLFALFLVVLQEQLVCLVSDSYA